MFQMERMKEPEIEKKPNINKEEMKNEMKNEMLIKAFHY